MIVEMEMEMAKRHNNHRTMQMFAGCLIGHPGWKAVKIRVAHLGRKPAADLLLSCEQRW